MTGRTRAAGTRAGANALESATPRAWRPWQAPIFAATWLAYAGYYFCRRPFYVAKADMGTELGLSPVDPHSRERRI